MYYNKFSFTVAVYLFGVIIWGSFADTMNSTFKEGECDAMLTSAEAIPFSSYKKTFILVVVPLVVAFGLFGNVALLFVVYRVQEMRTVTNFYLSNLAVSDSMLLINAAFQYIWTYFAQPVDYGGVYFPTGYLCALSNLCVFLFYFASVFIVILVTFERYLAICHPLAHRLVKGKSFTARMTAGAWLMSLIMACFILDVHETRKICIDWPDSSDYDGVSSYFITCNFETKCSWCWQALATTDFTQFAIAVIISIFMYGRIIYTLSIRSDKFHSDKNSDKEQVAKTRNQIARMLILNGVVFFLCLTPFQLINLYLFFRWWAGLDIFSEEEKRYVLWCGRVAMLLNSAINPILYNVSNGRYRKAFVEAFICTKMLSTCSSSKNKSPTPTKKVIQAVSKQPNENINI